MKSHAMMPVPGQIVKLDPMAVPSRSKYGFDKLGVGEAIYFSFSDVSGQRLAAATQCARKAVWGAGKSFVFRTDDENKRYMICRTA